MPASTDQFTDDERPTMAEDRWLASSAGQTLIRELMDEWPLGIKQAGRLRDQLGQPLYFAVCRLLDTAPKAVKKIIPGDQQADASQRMHVPLVTERGIQQATDWRTAQYKASRIPRGCVVCDVCAGVGGDAIALSRRGPLIAIDRDPQMCRYAAFNLRVWGGSDVVVSCDQAECLQPTENAWIHIDPDRRPHPQGRTSALEMSSPTAETIVRWLRGAAGATIKLAPAAELPAAMPVPAERQWISRLGECRQQVLWYGLTDGTSSPKRSATVLLADGQAATFEHADSQLASVRCRLDDAPRTYLYDLDPALRAAGLGAAFATQYELGAIGGPQGFFTSKTLLADRIASNHRGLVQEFALQHVGPFNVKHLKKEIAARGWNRLEIKVRGVDVLPEKLRPQLLGKRRGRSSKEPARSGVVLVGNASSAGHSIYAALALRV